MQKDTKPNEQPKLERIEFARTSCPRIIPHTPGDPLPPYNERDLGHWQARTMPGHIAGLCRELSRRGQHGIHLSKVNHDDLAELCLLEIPFKLTDWDKTNTWAKKLFVVPDVVFRFPEDLPF